MKPRVMPEFMQVPWKIWQAIWVFFAAWIVFPVLAIVALRFAAPSAHWANAILDGIRTGNVYSSFGLVLFSALSALGLVGFYLRKYGLSWQAVGWRRFSLRKAFLTVVVMFGIFLLAVAAVFALVTALDPRFNADQPQTNDFTGAPGLAHANLALLALVIIPPFIEETYFRGFLFPAISKRTGLVGGAIITSLLFGIAHLQANVGVYTFILSLLLCYLYRKVGSIIPGIVLHMANNYLAYLSLVHK